MSRRGHDLNPPWRQQAIDLHNQRTPVSSIAQTVGASDWHVRLVIDPNLRERVRKSSAVARYTGAVTAYQAEYHAQPAVRQKYRDDARRRRAAPPPNSESWHDLPAQYGHITESPDGKWLKCHECGVWRQSLSDHVAMHGLTADAYREQHGLEPGTRLIASAVRVGRKQIHRVKIAPRIAVPSMPEPPRKLEVGATVTDYWGDDWIVINIRTAPGVPAVPLGRPAGYFGRGGPTIFVTPALAEHLERYRHSPGKAGLPVGLTALKRLRRLLGHNRYIDSAAWWEARADDLATLTMEEFAARHGKSMGQIHNAKVALFGPTNRPNGWWRQPEITSLLRSGLPTSEIADQLGLSAGGARRLIWQARQQPTP